MPSQSTSFEISVSYVEGGRGTRLLWGLNPGDRIVGSGPYGRFVLRKEQVRTYYLVGTGTGVAPYRTMLPELAERIRTEHLRVHLLLGVREPAELLYGEEWVAFMRANPGFDFTACYSRVIPEEPQHWERKGYVQHVLADMDLHPKDDIVYLCGNPNMVDQAVELLTTNKGYSPYDIRREKYV
jgi:NAD(P)H-flavin reductase